MLLRQRPPSTPSTLYVASLSAAKTGLKFLADGDLAGARHKLEQAQQLDMTVFRSLQPLADTVLNLAAAMPVESGLAFCSTAGAQLLPQTAAMHGLVRWVTSRLHMRVVFGSANRGDFGLIERHLWPGLRSDPTWLLNYGVLAIGVRALRARWRKPRPGDSTGSGPA